MTWLALSSLPLVTLLAVVIALKVTSQRTKDRGRKTYLLTFPTDLTEQQVIAWLRAINGTLQSTPIGRMVSVPTIAFETWATDTGITHRMKVPWVWGELIARQLRLKGINVVEDNSRPTISWTRAVELGMTRPSRTLRIANHADLSASLLASVDTLGPGEMVLIQWVLTPAPHEQPPAKDMFSKSDDFSLRAIYEGPRSAKHDEIEDRRAKLSEPNFQAVGRIAARADTEPRAIQLVNQVTHTLSSAHSNHNQFVRQASRPRKLVERLNKASAPMFFPAQFNAAELAAIVTWPLGEPLIAGLPHGPSRQLYATEDVPRVGRILGNSNYSGHERPIALAYQHAAQHMYVGGQTGTGKSTLMANSFAQDVAHGYGGIVIDAKQQ